MSTLSTSLSGVGDVSPAPQSREARTVGSKVVLGLHLAVLSAFFVAYLGHLVVGPTIYFDMTTMTYGLSLVVILAAAALAAYHYRLTPLDMLLGMLYLFVLIRLGQYEFSAGGVQLPFSDLTLDEVNRGLGQFTLLVAVFIAGVVLAQVGSRAPRRVDVSLNTAPVVPLFAAFVVFWVLDIVVYSSPEASVFSRALFEKSEISVYLKVLLTALSADVFMFAMMYWFIAATGSWRRQLNLLATVLVVASIALYLYGSAQVGSRSGGLRVFMFAASIALAVLHYQGSRALWRAAIISGVAVIANFALLPAAHQARDTLVLEGVQARETVLADGVSEGATEAPSAAQIESDARALEALETAAPETVRDIVDRILNRFGYLDYSIITLSREPDQACVDRYMNWSHYFKNVVNFILPGDPYMESRLNSSNAFGICYRGVTEERMPRYTSEIWPLPGLAKIMAPGWELLICLGLGLAMGAVSRFLRGQANPYGMLIYGFWIFIFPTFNFFTMGVDHSIQMYIAFGLRLGGALAVIALTNAALRWFRWRRGAWRGSVAA